MSDSTGCPSSPVEDIDVWTLAERAASGMEVTADAEAEIATAATAEPDEDECLGCGTETHREFGHDRTPLCHACAHLFATALGRIVLRRIATAQHEARHKEQDVPTPTSRPYKPDAIRIDEGDWHRAGGDVTCSRCGFAYYDHADVRGYQTFHILCDGRIVKL